MDIGTTTESVPLVDQDVPNVQVQLSVANVLPQPIPTIMELVNVLMDSSSPSAPLDIVRDVQTILSPAAVFLKL